MKETNGDLEKLLSLRNGITLFWDEAELFQRKVSHIAETLTILINSMSYIKDS